MTPFERKGWVDAILAAVLSEDLLRLRAAWPDRTDDDRPAALGCSADADGMLHYGPFTVDDARMWASFLLMGPDELEALA